MPGGGEVQVLDYLTQQQKLFPALSLCFGLAFAAQTLWERYEDNVGAQDKGEVCN